jgi:polysaccharide export outer membrane protein
MDVLHRNRSLAGGLLPALLAACTAIAAMTSTGCTWLGGRQSGELAVDVPAGAGVKSPATPNVHAAVGTHAVVPASANVPVHPGASFPGGPQMPAGPGAVVEVRGQDHGHILPSQAVPRELQKISLQAYVLEPPDIVMIDVVRAVPKSPYVIEALDALQIVVEGTLEGQPIAGIYAVDPGGVVHLGPAYGAVRVKGLTITEARDAIERQLRASLSDVRVSMNLAQAGGQQQIIGEHLIGLDGTINLGSYGSVYVTGMTIDQARAAIEQHLSEFLEAPKISLTVFAYNSKTYYVIVEGAGQGDRVTRLPITGNETVLDAISNVGGLTALSSKTIWIARPAPAGVQCDQILPINWREITRGGSTATNYQVLPGDRIFISEDRFVALDSTLEEMLRPFERILGFSALGAQTIQQMQRFPKGFNQGGF